MEICKATTQRFKAPNKHNNVMYIEMESIINVHIKEDSLRSVSVNSRMQCDRPVRRYGISCSSSEFSCKVRRCKAEVKERSRLFEYFCETAL